MLWTHTSKSNSTFGTSSGMCPGQFILWDNYSHRAALNKLLISIEKFSGKKVFSSIFHRKKWQKFHRFFFSVKFFFCLKRHLVKKVLKKKIWREVILHELIKRRTWMFQSLLSRCWLVSNLSLLKWTNFHLENDAVPQRPRALPQSRIS